MPMNLIASNIVGSGGATSVTFSSIPATYTDLVIKMSARVSTNYGYGPNLGITFNGNTGTYISATILSNGSSRIFERASYNEFVYTFVQDSSGTANTFTNWEMYIPAYLSSNYKTVQIDEVLEQFSSSTTSNAVMAMSNDIWNNTSAINSITIQGFSGGATLTFVQYSSFYLYGIKNS